MTSEPTSAIAETTNATEGGWELFAHDTDIGVRGWGAGRAMSRHKARKVAKLVPIVCIKG